MIPSPTKVMWEVINEMIYGFLYDNKPEKLKRKTLIAPINKGGLKMIDLEIQNKAIKLGWMNRLINIGGAWRDFVIEQNTDIDFRVLLTANLKFADLPLKFHDNNIWKEIWLSWCCFNFKDTMQNIDEFLNQYLWYNINLKGNNRLLHYKYWEIKELNTFIIR